MATSSPTKSLLQLEANTSTSRGATITLTVEYRIRPPAPAQQGPIIEDVSMKKTVDVDMGTNGQYQQQAHYNYGNETNISTYTQGTADFVKTPKLITPTRIDSQNDSLTLHDSIEHISEDEKSTTSEEAFYEEWSEEFRCRLTEEVEPGTNRVIRSVLDETSERVRSDILKEEYKGKNVRVKRHPTKQDKMNLPKIKAATTTTTGQGHIQTYEEITLPPPSSQLPTQMTTIESSSTTQSRPWTSEETYTTEVVYDGSTARDIESKTQKFDSSSKTIDHVVPSLYSPIPSASHVTVSTIPSSHYEHISTIVTPTVNYASEQKQVQDDFVTEEYEVEVQQTKPRQETSTNDIIDRYSSTGSLSPTRYNSDWRNRYKEIYSQTSESDRFDQYSNYNTQRVPIISSNMQHRNNGIPVDISTRDRTYFDQPKSALTSPPRHVLQEPPTRNRIISTSSSQDINDRQQTSKHTYSSNIDIRQAQFQPITDNNDQPSVGRVGELKTAFETSRSKYIKEHSTPKYQTPITTGFTEQRRRIFEEREQATKEWTRKPINDINSNERLISETHTGPSPVIEYTSQSESFIPKAQPSEQPVQTESTTVTSSIETTSTQSMPQTAINIHIRKKPPTKTSTDADTSKLSKTKRVNDAGDESEDESSDPQQHYDERRRVSKSRAKDFAHSTAGPYETSITIQRSNAQFNERNMENILSHVPTSKGKGLLVELASNRSPSPTRSIYDQNKSTITSDSGIYDYSTATITQQLPTNSPTRRTNITTSISDDGMHTCDQAVYIDTSTTATSSSYARQQTPDTDVATNQYIDDPVSRSTYQYRTQISSNEPINHYQQPRTVRRQIRNSTSDDYENLSNYRSGNENQPKVSVITESRSRKPLIVDEIETIETETHVECQVQRINEIKESTKTERSTSPKNLPKRILPVTLTRSVDETTSLSKCQPVNERPRYYESIKIADTTRCQPIPVQIEETWFKPIERDQSQDSLHHSPSPNAQLTNSIEVTSLSPQSQVTFGKNSPSEIIAIVRVPELTNDTNAQTSSFTQLSHGISEPELNGKPKQDDGRTRLHYQRIHTTSYIPSFVGEENRQRLSRLQDGPVATKHDHSSPLTYQTRSSSYHSNSYERNQQSKQEVGSLPTRLSYKPSGQYQSGSLGNLLNSNINFEIEIEKRPPQQPQQPTVVSVDQTTRAVVTTSRDGRVSVQNIVARPGNTVTINSDFHASDRSLNRSSGYFSSDEPRFHGVNANYSSDEQANSPHQNYVSQTSSKEPYNYDQTNESAHKYENSSNITTGFTDTINQIDALYNNLDVQTNQNPKTMSTKNRRRELAKNSSEYSTRYTSTGFQHVPNEHLALPVVSINAQNGTTMPITSTRPSQPLPTLGVSADYDTRRPIHGSVQSNIVYQNRLNDQSQIVQRNRASAKQVKQKHAAKKRNGFPQGCYSDDDDNIE